MNQVSSEQLLKVCLTFFIGQQSSVTVSTIYALKCLGPYHLQNKQHIFSLLDPDICSIEKVVIIAVKKDLSSNLKKARRCLGGRMGCKWGEPSSSQWTMGCRPSSQPATSKKIR